MRHFLPAWFPVAALLLSTMPACGQNQPPALLSPRAVDRLPSAAADTRLPYGTAREQFGELRLPAGTGRVPVVVVIHGGCWIAEMASLQNTRALADALRRDGLATWNIEYRRLGSAGGGWPGTFLDIATGVDFVRTLARQFPRLDTTRVVVVGHSAGAHLALWAAARHRLPAGSAIRTPGTPLRPRGAVALDGPPDLAPFVGRDAEVCGAPVSTQLLGGARDAVPERWHDASPAALLPFGVPTRLVVGTPHGMMPAEAGRAWEQRAHAAGDA
ncbi:MAG: alpha/beta fold hydrolase, partial [Hymenobacteraceae bacterium]|nr:alpha/beta fold hydrolase [Hymenobacteraceae bacterium]